MNRYAYIAIFGLAGVFGRYFLSGSPWRTFAINVLGSFLIGVVSVSKLSEEVRLGLIVGLLGGFTTFSSYSLEGIRMIESREWGAATLYLVGSTVVGLAAVAAGRAVPFFAR